MKNIQSNVPVLMVFFNRPEPLKKVFEAVKNAKPKTLFIAQDGAREGNVTDVENVAKCREIVKEIDWDCEVYYDYSDVNLGCGRRMSSAISWAFESVDRLMILEDDCVPSKDFFPFCEELLEKYKDDNRISMISAMNHLGAYEKENKKSYLFCHSGAIWGWATWKRQWDLYDFDLKNIADVDIFDIIKNTSFPGYYKADLAKQGRDRISKLKNGDKLSSWTFQFNILRVLNNQLTIVPTKNMVSNVGITADSTHASGSLKQIPKALRPIFFMAHRKMEFPLTHPKFVYSDNEFDKKVWKLMAMPIHIALMQKIESVARRVLYASGNDRKKLFAKALKRLHIN